MREVEYLVALSFNPAENCKQLWMQIEANKIKPKLATTDQQTTRNEEIGTERSDSKTHIMYRVSQNTWDPCDC